MTTYKPLKIAMSYDDQIQHLMQDHKLMITDYQRAKHILKTVNYYRLSGYGIGLLDPATDQYKEGTSLEQLYALYQFDSHLRKIISPVIEYVEIMFRTAIAYHLAMQYGADGYMDRSNMHPWYSNVKQKDMYDEFCDQLKVAIDKQSRKPFVLHHKQVYGGRFPIWVAVELLSLGSLSTLYSLMKPADQQTVAKEFYTDAAYMKSWFAALVELRNICAHYGRIYNMPLDSTPKLPKKYALYHNTRLFADCLALRYIIRGQPIWITFMTELRAIIDECSEINLDFIGFPLNWESVLR